MKSIRSSLALIVILLLCTACGQQSVNSAANLPSSDVPAASQSSPIESAQADENIAPSSPAASVDVDLTELSSTMVFAEVANMMMQPDEYLGKTVRIRGIFTTYQDPQTEQVYCGVTVQDATACCAQGFDIVMPQTARYPNDYPADASEVTVCGTLLANEELKNSGIILLRLEDVTFE